MPRPHHTVEQILAKLCETEVALEHARANLQGPSTKP